MNKILVTTFSFLLLFFVQPIHVYAQPGCRTTSPGLILERFSHVFVGKIVEEKRIEGRGEPHFFVQVTENFKGMENQSAAVVRRLSDGCPGDFKVGEAYLFVTQKDEDGFFGAWAYSGVNWENQREYIEILRWKKSAPSTGLIVGTVLAENFLYVYGKQKPFNLSRVFLQNEQGAISETAIEPDGHFRFDNLTPGKYKVFLKLPIGLKPHYGAGYAELSVTTKDCFPINFSLLFDSAIGGKITNAAGEPLKSMVVRLYGKDKAGEEIELSTTTTDKTGKYNFKELIPGKYVLLAFPAVTT